MPAAPQVHVGASFTIQKNTFGIFLALEARDTSGAIVDISSASNPTDKQITLQKPDGTSTQVNATFGTDGTDGVFQRLINTGELDDPGVWRIQGYLLLSSGFDGFTEVIEFSVLDNI